jgi:aminoglycoside 6-adenylyltransferase
MTVEAAETDAVVRLLVDWADRYDAVRAVLLTSTRAIPGGVVDALSDYDVVLVVRDIHPFVEERGWLEDLGEVLVAYWDPIAPDPEHGLAVGGNVTRDADSLRIDIAL